MAPRALLRGGVAPPLTKPRPSEAPPPALLLPAPAPAAAGSGRGPKAASGTRRRAADVTKRRPAARIELEAPVVGSVVPRAGPEPRPANRGRSRYCGREKGGTPSGEGPPGRGWSLLPARSLLPRVPLSAPGPAPPASAALLPFPTPETAGGWPGNGG